MAKAFPFLLRADANHSCLQTYTDALPTGAFENDAGDCI